MSQDTRPTSVPHLSYRDAGVDIDAGNALVERIKPVAARTFRPGVLTGLGGFGALFELPLGRYRQPVLVSGTESFSSGTVPQLINFTALDVTDSTTGRASELYFPSGRSGCSTYKIIFLISLLIVFQLSKQLKNY